MKDRNETGSNSEIMSRRMALRHLTAGAAAITLAPMATGSLARGASLGTQSGPVTLAMVGGAHIHAPDFANRMADASHVTTKYVWDPDRDTAQARQEVTGGEITDRPEVIFNDEEVDGVLICSQTVRHKDLVPAAIRAGKHVFVEKPVGMNGAEARNIARQVNDAGVIFQTGYFMRSSPVNLKIRSLIQEGALGEITRLRLSNVHSGAIGGWFDDEWRWMADTSQSGVGAFGDLGSHVMDLLLWFMEGDSPRKCTGYIDTVLNRYPGCDEYGEGLVSFRSGAVATVAGGWVSRANPNQVEISGTEGHLRVTNNELYLTIPERDAGGSEPWTDLPEGYDHPVELFFRAVAGDSEVPLITADEAALTNHVITSIYNAHNAGRWVWL